MNKKTVATKLGKLLRQKRIDKEWTQDKLSEQLQLTHVSISTYERGVAIPNGYTFLKLIKTLGITQEDLQEVMELVDQDAGPKVVPTEDPGEDKRSDVLTMKEAERLIAETSAMPPVACSMGSSLHPICTKPS